MTRTGVDLERFRGEIEKRLLLNHHTQKEVVDWLQKEGVSITISILKNRCKDWGFSRRGASTDPTILNRVRDRFHTTTEDDSTIATTLSAEGSYVSARQVKRLRLANGWRRRAANSEQMAGQLTETFETVQQELDEGTIRAYGRGLVQTHLRVHQGHRAREDDVRDALRKLDKKGTAARRPGPKKRKRTGGEYIVRGPDWLWCIDGHDKFRNYGIGIYAAVDAFSRKILWFYLGNSNRRGVSILRQAVTTIRSLGRCPRFWRSDHGNEVLMLADAHFSFYREYKRSQGFTDDEVDSIRVRQCYMFGSSTANIKIESVWMRMIGSQTATWIVSTFLPPVSSSSIRLFI